MLGLNSLSVVYPESRRGRSLSIHGRLVMRIAESARTTLVASDSENQRLATVGRGSAQSIERFHAAPAARVPERSSALVALPTENEKRIWGGSRSARSRPLSSKNPKEDDGQLANRPQSSTRHGS